MQYNKSKVGSKHGGVPKRTVSFYIHWTPSFKHVIKTKLHIHIESLILIIDIYITKVLFYA
jgi:hypothetical protein